MNESLVIRILADGLVVPVALIGIYALLRFVPRGQKLSVYTKVLMAGLTAFMMAKIIGLLYQPSGLRPFEMQGVDAGASFLNNPGFPSDHALFVMAITLAVWFGTRHKRWALICLVLSLLVAIGRVVALVHTPLDVVGGLLIACVGVVWYLPFAKHKNHVK